MLSDDDAAKPKQDLSFPRNLEPMSLEALQEYIGDLEAEITRVKEEISNKQAAMNDAERFFR